MSRAERRIEIATGPRTLETYLALPDGPRERGPAVVVVHEIFGLSPHIEDVARRLAAEGYVAVAPDLFTGEIRAQLTPGAIAAALPALAQAPPELRRDPSRMGEFIATQPAERRPALELLGRVMSPAAQGGFARDLRAVTHHLAMRDEVDPSRIGAIGFCFGGAMVGRLATVDPDLRAAVIFYGQNPPLTEVPRIQAAVLGLYGGEDTGITSTVPLLAETMGRAGKRFEYYVYPGARHAFFNDTRPAYHAESAVDAWRRVCSFLALHLGRSSHDPI